MSEKVFVKGLFVSAPHENAPDFVLHDISIKCTDLVDFMRSHKNDKGYVNIQVLRSREGKPYAVLNDWKPEKKKDDVSGYKQPSGNSEQFEDDIPF